MSNNEERKIHHWCKCSTPEHQLSTIVMYGKLKRVLQSGIEVAWCGLAQWYPCSKCNDSWHTCWAKENPTDKEVEDNGECLLQLEDGTYVCSKCLKEQKDPKID